MCRWVFFTKKQGKCRQIVMPKKANQRTEHVYYKNKQKKCMDGDLKISEVTLKKYTIDKLTKLVLQLSPSLNRFQQTF